MLAECALIAAAALAVPAAGLAQSSAELCQPPEPGVNCGPGNGRQSVGGGGAAK
ncbi:MAG: hypothetical protein QOJ29_898, partial [Thermoleophilaceae bacterium]|nr:hypothetical protein [Thermoleophilaceae bacterium]